MHNLHMKGGSLNNRQRIFDLLVFYRWLSLIPPIALLLLSRDSETGQVWLLSSLVLSILVNLIITFFAAPLNSTLESKPWLLVLDLLFVSVIFSVTGGWRSPFYLYAINPLMAAGYFFQVHGALTATSIFLPLYLLAVLFNTVIFKSPAPNVLVVLTFIIGSYLISLLLGFVSSLFTQLQSAQTSLLMASQNLRVLHDLSISLQRSSSVFELQNHVLYAITNSLSFKRAVIGLVDNDDNQIGNWLAMNNGDQDPTLLPSPPPISLEEKDNNFIKFLQEQKGILLSQKNSKFGFDSFGIQFGLFLPLIWGVQPMGILLIDLLGHEEDPSKHEVLDDIARQTAASLGVMLTRIKRAKESAIQDERTRIALDLHDTISQSLFGLIYTLQGCLKLLPENSELLQPELEWALTTAEDVRMKIRATIHDMWPSEITSEIFSQDLRSYAVNVLQAAELELDFDIRGDFSILSPVARRSMYRICQEALTNIVNHAGANESRICVDIAEGRARLIVRDDGRGFEPDKAIFQTFDTNHFGLRGMRERAALLGGTCEFYSMPNEGTSIIIDIPANTQPHHQ